MTDHTAGDVMTVDERNRRILDELFRVIKKREATYGEAVVSLALSKNEKGEGRLCFGQIRFLGKDARAKGMQYDYGNFDLIRKSTEVKEVLDIMSSIFEKQALKIDDWPEIPLKIQMTETRFLQSRSRYGYASDEWPTLYAYGMIDDTTKGTFPQGSLSRLGLPLFPNSTEATNVFFELNLPKDWYTLDNRFSLFLPDYRARIKNLRLTGKETTIEVENKEIAETNLRAKFFCRTEKRSYCSDDVPLENGCASFSSDEEPFSVEAHIISTLEGDSIDSRNFDYRYTSQQEGVVIENSDAQLFDMISRGENETVEFKRELDAKKQALELLKSIVAFANTSGGTVFIGIDDNCRITGFKENVDAKIVDMIAARCDPSIKVQIRQQELNKLPITIIDVVEGTNKPYVLSNSGLFVRRGASDRQIKRAELDEIYRKKEQQTPFSR
ncbi:MAG: ATP-binding protein [Candidatus Bathyarchaeia archaeon]|jgi:hypothetical protein